MTVLDRVPLTVRHRFRTPMGRPLSGAEAWNDIRQTSSPFGMPVSRLDWIAAAQGNHELRSRATDIARYVGASGTLASYGVGTGLLECLLSGKVESSVCSDVTPVTLDRLADFLPEATVVNHDLRDGPVASADLHLFHRIDSEFSNQTWTEILPHFQGERLLLVMTELIGWRTIAREVVVPAGRDR